MYMGGMISWDTLKSPHSTYQDIGLVTRGPDRHSSRPSPLSEYTPKEQLNVNTLFNSTTDQPRYPEPGVATSN